MEATIFIESMKSRITISRFSEISERADRGTRFMKSFSRTSSWVLAVKSPLFSFDMIHKQAFQAQVSSLFSRAFIHLCIQGKNEPSYDHRSLVTPPFYFGFASEL